MENTRTKAVVETTGGGAVVAVWVYYEAENGNLIGEMIPYTQFTVDVWRTLALRKIKEDMKNDRASEDQPA